MVTALSSSFLSCGRPMQDEPVFPKLLKLPADVLGLGLFVHALMSEKDVVITQYHIHMLNEVSFLGFHIHT